MTACASPLSLREIVDYWAGDLDEASTERFEEHLFGCAACTEASAQVARIVHAFKGAIPPVLTDADLEGIEARGLVIEQNTFVPDERKDAVFRPGVDVLVHRLTGLELTDADRVSLRVMTESTGQTIFEDHFVPFSRDRGEILVSCQRHFAIFPPDVVFEVRAHDRAGGVVAARYLVPHAFG